MSLKPKFDSFYLKNEQFWPENQNCDLQKQIFYEWWAWNQKFTVFYLKNEQFWPENQNCDLENPNFDKNLTFLWQVKKALVMTHWRITNAFKNSWSLGKLFPKYFKNVVINFNIGRTSQNNSSSSSSIINSSSLHQNHTT